MVDRYKFILTLNLAGRAGCFQKDQLFKVFICQSAYSALQQDRSSKEKYLMCQKKYLQILGQKKYFATFQILFHEEYLKYFFKYVFCISNTYLYLKYKIQAQSAPLGRKPYVVGLFEKVTLIFSILFQHIFSFKWSRESRD